MQDDKIKFSDLYENFSGSGNINGKYWIVGLESGGNFNNLENEMLKILNTKNIFNILEYYNDFNQETVNDNKKEFLLLEKNLLKALNKADFHITKYLNGKEYFHYPSYGEIFRTNLFMLNIPNTNQEHDKQFENFIDFENKNTRDNIYDTNMLKIRANNFIYRVNNDLEKNIFLIIPSSYLNKALNFLNEIFASELSEDASKSDFFNTTRTRYFTEYLSTKPNFRVFHLPQDFFLEKDNLEDVFKKFGII